MRRIFKAVDWFALAGYCLTMCVIAWAASKGQTDGHTILFGAGLVIMLYGLWIARSLIEQTQRLLDKTDKYHDEAVNWRDEARVAVKAAIREVEAQEAERNRVQSREKEQDTNEPEGL